MVLGDGGGGPKKDNGPENPSPWITKEDDKNIGYVQLVPIGEGKWEIGYHVAKAYTGNGYARCSFINGQ